MVKEVKKMIKRKSVLISDDFHRELLDLQWKLYLKTGQKIYIIDILREAVELYKEKVLVENENGKKTEENKQ
jgi:hypothetical protein